MTRRPKSITVAEFDGLYAGDGSCPPVRDTLHPIDRRLFAKLEELALSLATKSADEPDRAILSISSRTGIGKVVTVRNYVGVILFDDGHQIEVLPKILRSMGAPGTPERAANEERARKIFLRMLHDAWDIVPAESSPNSLRTARIPVFEAFIRIFLDSANAIVKRGLAGGYGRVEENERFFKGKLRVAEHIRQNSVRRDRFFVAHDVFSLDNPANRILRSGLEWALGKARLESNQRLARQLLAAFEDVPASANLAGDFASCVAAERHNGYKVALDWCRLFLRGESVANLPGTRHAQALLFPMEVVFERFVARRLRRAAPEGMVVRVQDRSLHLFEQSLDGKAFLLQPDIVIRRSEEGATRTTIVDTKWKLLDQTDRNYGISTADMYQMYAYVKRHEADSAILVYPRHDALGGIGEIPPFFTTPGDANVRVKFVDLENPNESIKEIFDL